MASGLLQVVEEMGTLEGHVKVSSVWNRGKELVTGSRAKLFKGLEGMVGEALARARPFRRSSLPCIIAAIGSSRPSMTSFHTA